MATDYYINVAQSADQAVPEDCHVGLLLYVPVNSYGYVGTLFHLTTLFSWASLNKQLTST